MSVAEALATDNPLAEGLEPPVLHGTSLVIFGATGDLARRKLLPASFRRGCCGWEFTCSS